MADIRTARRTAERAAREALATTMVGSVGDLGAAAATSGDLAEAVPAAQRKGAELVEAARREAPVLVEAARSRSATARPPTSRRGRRPASPGGPRPH